MNQKVHFIYKTAGLLAICFATLMMIRCDSGSKSKGSRIAFKEVLTAKNNKLVSVFRYNESALESSDSWNTYTIDVMDPVTGSIAFSTRFQNDAYNDAGAVLHFSAKYVLLQTNELKAISLTEPGKVFTTDSIRKRIEEANPGLQNNIGELTVFSVNYLRVVSKQGDAFIISLNTFKAYTCKHPKNTFIDDSLAFEAQGPLPLKNVFGPNYTQRVVFNDSTVVSLECEDINNTSKNFLYTFQYILQKRELQNFNNGMVSYTDSDTALYRRYVNEESKVRICDKPFLVSRMIGLVNGSVYILHQNELGDSAKELLSKFDITRKVSDWSINLNDKMGFPNSGNLFTEWAPDSRSIYFGNFSQSTAIYKFDALTGKLIYTIN